MDEVITTPEGRRVGVLTRGSPTGRPVMYLHGQPASRFEQCLWADDLLERHDVKLVSVDRPGYGQTDPLAGDRVQRSSDVLAVADALGLETFALMAVSAGGSYALSLAAAAPDRTEQVVLVCAQMPYDDASALTGLDANQAAIIPFLHHGRTEQLIAGAEKSRSAVLADPIEWLASGMASMSRRERDWFARPSVRDVFRHEMVEALARSVDGFVDDLVLWPRAFEVDLTRITCPVRAVHGTVDDWEPISNLRRILDELPDAHLIELHGLSHLGPLLEPDTVFELLRLGTVS